MLGTVGATDVRTKLREQTKARQIEEELIRDKTKTGQLFDQEQRQRQRLMTRTVTELAKEQEIVYVPPERGRFIPPPFKFARRRGKERRASITGVLGKPMRTPSFTALAPVGLIRQRRMRGKKKKFTGLEVRGVLGSDKLI